MKKASLKEIARYLRISESTVSLTLNGRGDENRISKETQKRIIDYTQKIDYKPNSFAKGLAKGKSEIIGLVIPNISDVFFSRIARRIEKQAEQAGYDVIFSSTGESCEREAKKIQQMLNRQVDGLIIASCLKNSKDILQLKKNNFPFVLIDRQYPEIETNFIGFDDMKGVASAVEHLIRNGKKRIGFVSVRIGLSNLHERLESYKLTMKKNKLAIEDGFIREVEYNNIESDIQNVIKDLVQNPSGVEAIVFATPFLTAEGLRQLKALNVRIPDDLAIVSYAQKEDFDIYEPAITSVKLPTNELGDMAVDMLLRNMKDKNFNCESLRLNSELVVRKSCGAS